MKPITIQYHFTSSDVSEVFHVNLDARTLALIDDFPDNLPSWAKLDFHQCPHCPLSTRTHPYCPLTANIVSVVKRFEHLLSYHSIHLKVVTDERVISQDTTVQRAVSSLLGLISATSGCPHTAFFRPMARFHLPLATEDETIYRVASMYMLAQYFLNKSGGRADFEQKKLSAFYENIQIVNGSIARRLQNASKTDSVVNAIILLDIYAQTLPYSIEKSFEEIRHLFEPFVIGSVHP